MAGLTRKGQNIFWGSILGLTAIGVVYLFMHVITTESAEENARIKEKIDAVTPAKVCDEFGKVSRCTVINIDDNGERVTTSYNVPSVREAFMIGYKPVALNGYTEGPTTVFVYDKEGHTYAVFRSNGTGNIWETRPGYPYQLKTDDDTPGQKTDNQAPPTPQPAG